jgi:hypothetical protein
MATKTKPAPIEVTLDTSQQIKLKNRDLIDFHRVTGKRFVGAMKELEASGDDPDWMTLTALLWVLVRRDQPDYTFEDALDSDIDRESLMALTAMISDPMDPTEPAGTPAN